MVATRVSVKGETARFQVMLRRGKTYRIWFSVQACATAPLISGAEVKVRAAWSKLSVGTDEDESIAAQLESHGDNIKTKADQHDIK